MATVMAWYVVVWSTQLTAQTVARSRPSSPMEPRRPGAGPLFRGTELRFVLPLELVLEQVAEGPEAAAAGRLRLVKRIDHRALVRLLTRFA